MIRNLFCMAIVGVALSALTLSAMADTINVDFGPSDANPSGVYSGTAVAPDGGLYWNGVAAGVSFPAFNSVAFTSSALKDSNSNATGVTVTLQPTYHAGDGGDSVIAPALMHDYVFTQTDGSPFEMSIDGLASGQSYDLYLYSGTGAQGTTFTVDGVSKNVTDPAGQTSFVQGSNYQLFSGVTATDGSISVTVAGYNAKIGVLDGLQIVGTFAVPEPSACLMTLTCVFGLLAYAWRKRS